MGCLLWSHRWCSNPKQDLIFFPLHYHWKLAQSEPEHNSKTFVGTRRLPFANHKWCSPQGCEVQGVRGRREQEPQRWHLQETKAQTKHQMCGFSTWAFIKTLMTKARRAWVRTERRATTNRGRGEASKRLPLLHNKLHTQNSTTRFHTSIQVNPKGHLVEGRVHPR